MTTQHTPGPWIGAGPSFGGKLPQYIDEIVTDRDGENDCCTICTFPFAFDDAEQEANARLIAAAPDLLAALKEVLAAVRHSNRPPETVMQFEEKVDRVKKAAAMAESAIEKAEGGAS